MPANSNSPKKPIVSVCIQTYQHKNYIGNAIESVLMQKTDFPFEILIGEDESTDGTREICIDYAKRYPTKIRLFLNSRKNVIHINGQPTGRWNLLNNIKHSDGRYIALLPGDDYWTDPLKLQKQVDFLENHPDFSGCFHETQLVMEDGKLGKVYGKNAKLIMTAEDTFATLSPFHSSSFVFKNELGELPDWFFNIVSADMALFSICASYGPLGKIPEIMSVYRKLNSGLTNTTNHIENFHQHRIELMNYLNKFHNFKYQTKVDQVISSHEKRMEEQNQSQLKLKNNMMISNNKNKIVTIQGGFPSVSATFILDQMTGLIDRGFEIENWATYDTETTTVHKDIEKYNLLNKTKYIAAPSKKLMNEPEEWLQAFMKKNNISSFDDVRAFHIHYGSNFNRFEPLFRLSNKFILVSFHGYDASRYFAENGDDCYNFLFKRADLITTPSHFMKNELVKRGCDPAKVIIHRYGINLDKFSCKNRTFKKDKIVFLTVGRFVEKKGIEYSLRAFAKIHKRINSEYRIVGEGELHKKYEQIVEEEGIGEYVKFLGPKTKTEVIEEMQKADAFVLTSVVAENGDSEGVPVSLTEAHAMGLPVVSSYHAGIPELVFHEKTGFLSPEKDIETIAGNMLKITSDMDLRKTFSQNAETRVKEEFDIIKLNDSLYSILNSGIKRNGKNIRVENLSNENNIKFEELLCEKNWQYKRDLYLGKLDSFHIHKSHSQPDISIIVISWRLHPDNLKNFKILEKQRDQNYELIFVDNGGKEGEFEELKPYVDTYVRLNTNTGAYLARNIGAVFAKAPILLFLEDDGIPEHDFIKAHLDTYKKYDVIAVRGVYSPKTDNPFNKQAIHYYLGDMPFPYPGNLEGNSSYMAVCFFKVGGWDDDIMFGYGGRELSLKLLDIEPDQRKQIYSPAPVIYHDFAVNESHLVEKRKKQDTSLERLKKKYPHWDDVTKSWSKFLKKYDLLIIKNPPYDKEKIESLVAEEKYLDAINYLKTISLAKPENAAVFNYMGSLHLKIDEYELALKNFLNAVKLEPQNPGYKKDLAKIYVSLNENKKAIAIYKSIISEYPEDVDTLMDIADFNYSRNYSDIARHQWATVLKKDPGNTAAKKKLIENKKGFPSKNINTPSSGQRLSILGLGEALPLDILRSYKDGNTYEAEILLLKLTQQFKGSQQ